MSMTKNLVFFVLFFFIIEYRYDELKTKNFEFFLQFLKN